MLLLIFLPLTATANIRYDSQQQELFIYKHKIKASHQILSRECFSFAQTKRQANEDTFVCYNLKIAKQVYSNLVKELVRCHNLKSRANHTPTKMTTQTTLSATTKPPITVQSTIQPNKCLTATNLTQSWRVVMHVTYTKICSGLGSLVMEVCRCCCWSVYFLLQIT